MQLITVPLLTRELGYGEYAAYALAISLMPWFALVDFGIASALQNIIVEGRVRGTGSDREMEAAFGGAVLILLGGCVLTLLLGPLLARLLFSRMPFVGEDLRLFLFVSAGLFFVASAVGNIGTKILYASGRGAFANLLTIAMTVSSFVLLVACVHYLPRSVLLPAAVLCYVVPLGLVGASMTFRLLRRPAVLMLSASWAGLRGLWKTSRGFWTLAILGAMTHSVDYLIMSQTLTVADISTYNVLYRLFWVGMTFYLGLLTATWPVMTEAFVSGKPRLLWRTLGITIGSGMAFSVAFTALLMVFIHPLSAMLFPQNPPHIELSVVLLFGLYICLRVWSDTFSIALQAINETHIFLRFVPIQALLSVGLQWWLSKSVGLSGILLGLIFSHLLTATWLLPWWFYRTLTSGKKISPRRTVK